MTKCLMNVMPPPSGIHPLFLLPSIFKVKQMFQSILLHHSSWHATKSRNYSLLLNVFKSYIFEVKKIHSVLLFTFKSSASLCSFTGFVFLNYAFPLPQQPSDLFLPQPSNLSFKQWLAHSLAFFHLHLDIRSTASSKPSKETFSFMLASL